MLHETDPARQRILMREFEKHALATRRSKQTPAAE